MRSLVTFLLLVVLIAGCSGHAGNEDSGRIAAVVNGVEITQREVDFIYRRSVVPGTDDAAARNQRRSILAGLVRTELLAQQAAKMKLDQSPEYVLAMHNARRRVLAGLAEEKIVSTLKPVSREAVQNVISGNPAFFSGRKLLVFDEVLISGVNVPLLESLNASAGKGASLAELLDAVKAKGVEFQRSTKTVTSDQLQPAILKVLSDARPKVPVVIRVEDKFSMILVLHTVTPVPVEGRAAAITATNLLQSQLRNTALSQKMSGVLDAATITYFGEYKPDSSDAKKGLAALPAPNAERAKGVMTHRIRLAVTQAVAFMGAMLLLFISKTILSGQVWKPRLWRARKNADAPVTYDYDVFDAPPGVKLILFVFAVLGVVVAAFQFVLLWEELPFWMIGLGVVTGIVAGLGVSRVFALPALKQWAMKLRWLFLVCFASMIIVALLVTMRIIFV